MQDSRVTDRSRNTSTLRSIIMLYLIWDNKSFIAKQNVMELVNNDNAALSLYDKAYLFWSKNSIERLMISSSVIILLSSSATSPRSSLDPLEAMGKKKKTHTRMNTK